MVKSSMVLRSALVVTSLAGVSGVAFAQEVTGAGATFPAPLYAKWADAYKKEQEEAAALKKKLSDADAKYEAEKAKKQAEFNAKLLEREQALAQEKALRAQEAEEARKDKFLYLGGLICLAGVGCLVFGPKLIGLQLFGAGIAVSSIPTVWGSPYFIYIVGVFVLIAAIAILRVVFRKKPACEEEKPSDTQPPA